MPNFSLQGKRALVTGGSRGIGRAIAESFAAAGADVAICFASRSELAEEVVAAIESRGRKALAVQTHVADGDQVESLVNQTREALGGIDILVCNAGITRDGLLARMKPDQWAQVIDTNLRGTYNCCRSVLRPMLKQQWGRIINVSSVVGLTGNAGQSNYAASKAGIIGFTKSLAKEVGSRNITANVIAPGYTKTDMTAALPEAAREALMDQLVVPRLGEPADVAAAAVFLASEAAGYITGQVLSVDGGLAM